MKPRLNQSGQAAVEYVLLLVLTVAIVVAVAASLFTPLKKFTDFYLGTYTQCLLDYGVLPLNPNQKVSDCQQLAISTGMTGSGQGGSNGQNATQQAAQNNARASAEAMRANMAAHQHAGSRSGAGATVVNSHGNKVDFGPQNGADQANDSTTTFTNVSNTDNYSGGRRWRTPTVQGKKIRGVAGGVSQEELEKIARAGEVQVVRMSDLPGRPPKKMLVKPPPPKAIVESDAGTGKMSFGNLFRLMIMAMIIIAVVVVVGSQLNSISKSMDG